MKKILINKGLSSGLRSEFNHINFIEIEDKPFAVGGFGEVYNCISIDGIQPQTKQVIKIFIDNSKGSAEHNFKTTQKLQKKVDAENQKLLRLQNRTLIEIYPAFISLPQFSFRGNINGTQVIGFSSDNLVSLGFTDFEHFLQDAALLSQYQRFPMERKMLIAYQLVSAFKVLEEFYFIHADLKPGAMFINLKSAEIAIIDYDSGVITENATDEPLTWGAANDWVAPEIWEQQSNIQRGEKIQVDLYSDRWSVAIGIHYLMSTFHPLFYLTELSPRVSKQYFTPLNQWPLINKNAPYFQKANEAIYDQYLPWINTSVPKVVLDKISHTINFGYKNPVARTSYSDWKIAFQAVQTPPKIRTFICDKTVIINGVNAKLSWEVENAHTVEIDNGIGQVQHKGSIQIKPNADLIYRINAIGFFGQSSDQIKIRVFPTPVIETFKVPMPDFSSILMYNPISTPPPTINIKINFESNNVSISPTAFTELNENIDNLKHYDKKKLSNWNLSKVFEELKALIKKK